LEATTKISVIAGDIEIDLEGAAMEVEEQLLLHRQDDTWTIMLGRLAQARSDALEAAVSAAKEKGLPSVVQRSECSSIRAHLSENPTKSWALFTTSVVSKASMIALQESSINCLKMQKSTHPATFRST